MKIQTKYMSIFKNNAHSVSKLGYKLKLNTFPYKQPKEKKRLHSEIESCHVNAKSTNEDSSEVRVNILKQWSLAFKTWVTFSPHNIKY